MNDRPAFNITDIQSLALLAAGKTGADIERLVRDARAVARRRRRELTWTDLEALLTRNAGQRDSAFALRLAVHEIGHAIAYTVTGIGRVDTISIIDADGAACSTALDRFRFQDEAGLTTLIACLLAGRSAEKLVFNDVMVGAGGGAESDLARATGIAVDMETTLGLGSDQPLLHRAVNNVGEAMFSHPELAAKVNARLESAELLAKSLLSDHVDTLSRLAVRLAEAGVLAGDDVRTALIGDRDDAPS